MKKTTKRIIGVLAAGAGLYALSQMTGDSTTLRRKKTVMATSANPAFTFPKGTELDGTQENEVLVGIFANRGLDFKKMGSGGERKISEAEYNQLMNDLKDAINHYPSAKNIAKIRDDFIKYKANFIGGYHHGYHANAGYHMGQIDGISGVY